MTVKGHLVADLSKKLSIFLLKIKAWKYFFIDFVGEYMVGMS